MKMVLIFQLLLVGFGACYVNSSSINEKETETVVTAYSSPVPKNSQEKKRPDAILEFTVYSMVMENIFYGDRWGRKIGSQFLGVKKTTILPDKIDSLPPTFASNEVNQSLKNCKFEEKNIERGYDVYATLVFEKGNSLREVWEKTSTRKLPVSFVVGLSEVIRNSDNTEGLVYVEIINIEGKTERAYCRVVFEGNTQESSWHYFD